MCLPNYNIQVISGRDKLGHGCSLGGINRFSDLVTATWNKMESVGPSTKPLNTCRLML